jgi:tetratricopeptide (TPR) repeat protein
MDRDSRLPAVLLCIAVLAAYFNSFAGSFQFDDYNVIVGNPAVHSAAAWFDAMPGIRPLLKLSYTLNWIAGPAPFGFHLVNVAVHAANAVLVYLLLGALRRRREAADLVPFLVALLFALHPAQTEAVTYISGRSSSLMALFYLGALLAYVHAADSPSPRRLRALSLALFACALLTKETAATLPLALLLVDAIDRRRERWVRADLAGHRGYWLLLALGLAAAVASPTYRQLLAASFSARGIADNLLSQINAVWYLAGQLLLPWRLNVDPDLPLLAGWTPALCGQAAVLAALVALGFAGLRRRAWTGFAVLWFFLHLLPTNSLLPRLDLVNDRQLYLASIGAFLAAAVALQALIARARRRWLVNAVVGALLLGLGFATLQRNRTYHSEIAFWEDAAAKSPGKARVFNNLGFAYQQQGRYADARQAYRRAMALDPDYWKAHINFSTLPQQSRDAPSR